MPTRRPVLRSSSPASQRTLGALASCVALALPAFASAGVKNWNVAGGLWATPGSWSPVGAPGVADSVFIGNTAAAANGFVTLNTSATVLSVALSDGMTLATGSSKLVVTGELSVSDASGNGRSNPARFLVQDGPSVYDADVGSLTVGANADLRMDGGTLLVQDAMHLVGAFQGQGTIVFADPASTVLVNDGILDFWPGFTQLAANGTSRFDLDGGTVDEPSLNLTLVTLAPYTAPQVRFNGIGLTDSFDDRIALVGGAELEMDLDEGWAVGPSGTIQAIVNGNANGLARVQGSEVTIGGAIDVIGSDDGGLIFDAPSVLLGSAVAHVDADCLLWFFSADVQGGTYTMEPAGRTRFSGPTTVEGGTFVGSGTSAADGGVLFSGATTYSGTVDIVGYGSQDGDAMILGPTTINADTFHFGGGGAATWTVSNALVVNADSLGFANWVYDNIDLTGTLQGKLAMHLAEPQAPWYVSGDLTLGGLGPFLLTRIEGNPLVLEGQTTVAQSVQVTAPLTFATESTTSFAGDTSRLRLTADVEVRAGATFAGGRVEVGSAGSILLADGADLGTTDLQSEGGLAVADGPGMASVDRLTMTATSTWTIEIGGYDAGTRYDELLVNGTGNTLGGQLDVRVIDGGDGLFEPQVGDVFTVMMAPPASLGGFFANAPVSHVPGRTYLWNVNTITGEVAHIVTLTVAGIVSCEADLNGDGQVDPVDLAILLGEWGPNAGSVADFNDDGLVAADDLAVLLGAWGLCVVQ